MRAGSRAPKVGRFENRPQRPFGGHWVPSDELPVPREHAAEVLGPRAVDGAVDDHMPDPPRAKFLRVRREPEVGVDLPFGEQALRLGPGMDDPVDVLARVQAHVGG